MPERAAVGAPAATQGPSAALVASSRWRRALWWRISTMPSRSSPPSGRSSGSAPTSPAPWSASPRLGYGVRVVPAGLAGGPGRESASGADDARHHRARAGRHGHSDSRPAILRGRLRHRAVLDRRPGAHPAARPSGTPPERRGRVVGNVMAGLLTGIMLARPLSLFIAASFGWRAVFWLSAALMLGIWSRSRPQAMPRYRPPGVAALWPHPRLDGRPPA